MTKIKTAALIMSIIGLLAACRHNTKPAETPISHKSAIPVKKDFTVKYAVKNNLKMRDFDKTFADWGAPLDEVRTFTNYPVIDQVMKYDAVKVWEIRSNWAYVETQGQSEGWVAAQFLKDWNVKDFFDQKENIFPAKEKMVLYSAPLGGKQSGTIGKGESYRVLKGNGEYFFVVTMDGDAGWVETQAVDTKKLVAKGFGYKERKDYEIPESKIYEDYDGKPLYYNIEPGDALDDNLLNGNIDKVVKIQSKSTYNDTGARIPGYVISKDGKETNVTETLRTVHNVTYQSRVTLNGKEYRYEKEIIYNFFGMIAFVEVYIPRDYLNTLYDEAKKCDSESYDRHTWKTFDQLVESLRGRADEEIVRITFYSRDANLKKIKEMEFKGQFAFYTTVRKFLAEKVHQVQVKDGGLEIEMGVAYNGVLLDEIFVINEYDENGNPIPDYLPVDFRGEAKFKGKENALRPKMIQLSISQGELEQAGLKASEVKKSWDNYVYMENYIRENKVGMSGLQDRITRVFESRYKVLKIEGKEYKLGETYNYYPSISVNITEGKVLYVNFSIFQRTKGPTIEMGGGGVFLNGYDEEIYRIFDDSAGGVYFYAMRNGQFILGLRKSNSNSMNSLVLKGAEYEY